MSDHVGNTGLRNLPSVDRVLGEPALAIAFETYRRDILVGLVRDAIAAAREDATRGNPVASSAEIAHRVAQSADKDWSRWPTPVINATGVVIHTNLGRSPLSASATEAMLDSAQGFSDLEMDLDTGRRGSRYQAISAVLRQLVGSPSSIIANNNAGAMLLGLAAVASGGEIIVSRGEASEIGGGFRIPDVLSQSGTRLVEVGTVNRTYADDYANAITPNTKAILVVHRSNFQVIGFTHEPKIADLIAVGEQSDIPVLHDLGSGALLPTEEFGMRHEPMPKESLEAGASLVFFSGDKLIGGPQAGIIVGKEDYMSKVAQHPIARALRADKLTLAALHATLLHYLRDEAREHIPIWRMISVSAQELSRRARTMAKAIGRSANVISGHSAIGGGTMPGDWLETTLLRIDAESSYRGADGLSQTLRYNDPHIIARIDDGFVVLDPRTIPPGRDADVVLAINAALGSG